MALKNELQEELRYFESKRKELCEVHLGQFVLVKGSDIHGFYQTDADALEAGVQLFGDQSFLIKQVLTEEPVHEFVSFTME